MRCQPPLSEIFSALRSPRRVSVPFSIFTSMSSNLMSGTSAFTTSSFSFSTISTGGTHGRPFGSANSLFIVSWKAVRPGNGSTPANGEYLIIAMFVNLSQINYKICALTCQVVFQETFMPPRRLFQLHYFHENRND